VAQTRHELEELTRAFYREVDANDEKVFDRRFASDAVLEFNDFPTMSGPDGIAGMVTAWKSSYRSIEHDLRIVLVDQEASTTVAEIVVGYVFPDGTLVSVRGCSISAYDDEGLMTGWRVYVDTSRSTPPA
jgi:hypothetical protein